MSKTKKRTIANDTLQLTVLYVLAVLAVSLAVILLIPDFKAESSVIPQGELGVPIPGARPVTNFFEYASAVIDFCIRALGPALATLMIIYGGYQYIFAMGDNTKMTNAKTTIFSAIYGYSFLFLAKFIISFLGT